MMKLVKSHCLQALVFIALQSVAPAAEFVLDLAKSKVTIEVKATGHDFSGTLNKFQASATLDRDLKPTAGKMSWNFADLKTGNGSRDSKMLSWMEAPKLGAASFTFREWLTDASGKTSAKGVMSIHGVEKEVTFPVAIKNEGGLLVATGSATIDHTDYKLPIISFLKFFKVNPSVRIAFEVKGSLK